jgi:hypothetical protein
MSMDEYNRRLMATPNDSAKHDALYEAHGRVGALERLNSQLAAQVDRQAKVVDAAIEWADHAGPLRVQRLGQAVATYDMAMAQLGKER